MLNICTLAVSPKLGDLLNYFSCMIVRSVVPLLFAIAFVVFIIGVIKFIAGSGEETKRAEGQQFMLWGIIALTVMFSIWGIVSIVNNTFGIRTVIPQLQTR